MKNCGRYKATQKNYLYVVVIEAGGQLFVYCFYILYPFCRRSIEKRAQSIDLIVHTCSRRSAFNKALSFPMLQLAQLCVNTNHEAGEISCVKLTSFPRGVTTAPTVCPLGVLIPEPFMSKIMLDVGCRLVS